MDVDATRRHDLAINIDIAFLAIPCAVLSIDVNDASGTSESDTSFAPDVHLHKLRLDAAGRRLAKTGEYHTPQTQRVLSEADGAPRGAIALDLGAAMQHMGDMDEEIGAHEGCRVRGDVRVRRVAGRIAFSVHQGSMLDMLPQMLSGRSLPRVRNMSHIIHKVSFGPEFPGQVNPLDKFARIEPPSKPLHAYKYFLKVVPTDYFTRLGLVLETNQYSVSEYAVPLPAEGGGADGVVGSDGQVHDRHVTMRAAPDVELSYDMSPILVSISESPATLLHFATRLCAVVGGAVAITQMLDRLVHSLMLATGLTSQRVGGIGESGGGASAAGMSSPTRQSIGGGSMGGGRMSASGLVTSSSGPLSPTHIMLERRYGGGGSSAGGGLPHQGSGGGLGHTGSGEWHGGSGSFSNGGGLGQPRSSAAGGYLYSPR